MLDESQRVIQLGGLTISILQVLFPESDNYSERNIVNCYVKAEANGAVVSVQDEHIHTDELQGFALGLTKVYDTLEGECELAPLGANFRAKVAVDGLGHLNVKVIISPDWGAQSHDFKFQIDQSHLPAILSSIWEALEQYPTVGRPWS